MNLLHLLQYSKTLMYFNHFRYTLREAYWHVLAARLAFVVVFQNFVALSVMAIRYGSL